MFLKYMGIGMRSITNCCQDNDYLIALLNMLSILRDVKVVWLDNNTKKLYIIFVKVHIRIRLTNSKTHGIRRFNAAFTSANLVLKKYLIISGTRILTVLAN